MKTQGALKIRSVTDQDCRLLWEWVNDPVVRASAFDSHPISWQEHLDWFQRKHADPSCALYLLMDGQGHPMGQARFDRQPDGSAEIDISLSKEYRGRGVGLQALRLACETFRAGTPMARIVAAIKPENIASVRIFQKGGFLDQGKGFVKGHEAVFLSLDLQAEITEIILAALKGLKNDLGKGLGLDFSLSTVLYGTGSDVDSLALIQLLIDVEKRIGERYGPVVTLTDSTMLSGQESPLRSVSSLAEYLTTLVMRPRS